MKPTLGGLLRFELEVCVPEGHIPHLHAKDDVFGCMMRCHAQMLHAAGELGTEG